MTTTFLRKPPSPLADTRAVFDDAFTEHIAVARVAHSKLADAFVRLVYTARNALASGGKILLFGNGGSAADAQHIAAEFVVRYRTERPALPAIALTCDSSILTAAANDYSYDLIFARQIEALGRASDLAIGISTSGNSRNVLLGLEAARSKGLAVAAFSGGTAGKMAGAIDPLLVVPSTTVARIQEMHILLGHMLCEALDSCPA